MRGSAPAEHITLHMREQRVGVVKRELLGLCCAAPPHRPYTHTHTHTKINKYELNDIEINMLGYIIY